ncbi:MAG: pirin family protein, partial [Actinomycetota bacterium]
MPAVTVDDLSALPALVEATGPPRAVRTIVAARQSFEGAGFPVHRPFPQPGADTGVTDPFLMLDEMGPVHYAPGQALGAPDHPHRGFETVTYLLDGEMEHRDSTGGGGLLRGGDTQWMTAGSGLV